MAKKWLPYYLCAAISLQPFKASAIVVWGDVSCGTTTLSSCTAAPRVSMKPTAGSNAPALAASVTGSAFIGDYNLAIISTDQSIQVTGVAPSGNPLTPFKVTRNMPGAPGIPPLKLKGIDSNGYRLIFDPQGWAANELNRMVAVINGQTSTIIANDGNSIYLAWPYKTAPAPGSDVGIKLFLHEVPPPPKPSTPIYTIRGVITYKNDRVNLAAAGVKLMASMNGDACLTDDALGEYICGVWQGWSGTINVSLQAATKFKLVSSSRTTGPVYANAQYNFEVALNPMTGMPVDDLNHNGIPDWNEVDTDKDGIPDWVEATGNHYLPNVMTNPLGKDNDVHGNAVLFANQLWRDTYVGSEFTPPKWIAKLTTIQTTFNNQPIDSPRVLTQAELATESFRSGVDANGQPLTPMFYYYPLRVLRHSYAFLGQPSALNQGALDLALNRKLMVTLISSNQKTFDARQPPTNLTTLDAVLAQNNAFLTGVADAAFMKMAKIRAGMPVDGAGNPAAIPKIDNVAYATRAAYLTALAEAPEFIGAVGMKRKFLVSESLFAILAESDYSTWNFFVTQTTAFPDALSIVDTIFRLQDENNQVIYDKRFY